jgi:hypothetical protein
MINVGKIIRDRTNGGRDQECQRKWHNRVENEPPEILPPHACFCRPTGRRDIGHPKIRWSQ